MAAEKYKVAKKFMVKGTGVIFEVGQVANQFSKEKTEEYLEKGLIELDKEAMKEADKSDKSDKKADKK